jgi:predicted RNA-binding protein YlxR (DUF448 family)
MLIRMVKKDGRWVVDERQRMPGRGAYAHHACLDRAQKNLLRK